MKDLVVFVDTDVVISSLISKTGAAYLLLQKNKKVDLWLSNFSETEITGIIDRLKLNLRDWQKCKNYFKFARLDQNIKMLRRKYQTYTMDIDDAHIIAGAMATGSGYLLTYNIRHYFVEKLKELNIIVLTPGQFLQYLRTI